MDHEQVTTTQLYAAHKMNVKRELVKDMEWELERKEGTERNKTEKRITVISVLIIFIAGTFGASFAFAAKTDDSTKKGKSRVESVFEEAGDDSDQNGTDRLDQKKSVLKGTPDTSWF